MSAKFKGQRQWIREVLNNLGELEKHQPKPFNQNPEWPEWVSNLVMGFFGVSHPGVKMKNVKNWKAKDLGRFLGRQYAGECLMEGGVPLTLRVVEEAERATALLDKWVKDRMPDIDLANLQKQHEKEAKAWRLMFMKFMQETLSSACGRPYLESSAFFEAFGKAVVIKPDDLLTERTMDVGDKLRWAMFLMWPQINQCHSIGELHRALEQGLKPKGIIVKYKMVEKLCQRIKLKFKEPGRPPGSKIQTNPTSVKGEY